MRLGQVHLRCLSHQRGCGIDGQGARFGESRGDASSNFGQLEAIFIGCFITECIEFHSERLRGSCRRTLRLLRIHAPTQAGCVSLVLVHVTNARILSSLLVQPPVVQPDACTSAV